MPLSHGRYAVFAPPKQRYLIIVELVYAASHQALIILLLDYTELA
jgi:hypothetical protein